MVNGAGESSNPETPPDTAPSADFAELFDTLADWNHQLKHAKVDFRGPQP